MRAGRVRGTDNYQESNSGNTQAQISSGSITGGGTWTRTSSGSGSTLASGNGTNNYTHSTMANELAGIFGQSQTGQTRYQLVQRFEDVSNANSGTTPGHTKFSPVGLPFRDPEGHPADQAHKNQLGPGPISTVEVSVPVSPQQYYSELREKYGGVNKRQFYQKLKSATAEDRKKFFEHERNLYYWNRYAKATEQPLNAGDGETDIPSFNSIKNDKAYHHTIDGVIGFMVEKYGGEASKLLLLAEKLEFEIILEGGYNFWWRSDVNIDKQTTISIDKFATVEQAADELFTLLKNNLSDEKISRLGYQFGLRGRHGGILKDLVPDLDLELAEMDQIWSANVKLGLNASGDFAKGIVRDKAFDLATGGTVSLLSAAKAYRKYKSLQNVPTPKKPPKPTANPPSNQEHWGGEYLNDDQRFPPKGTIPDVPLVPNNFRGPNSRHRLTKVDQSTVAKDLNTVIEPGVDVAADVTAINQGLAQRVGDKFVVNGRTYGVHDGTLYPISGLGLHQLDRGGFKALGVFNKFGDSPRAAEIMQKMGLTQVAIDAGRIAWKAGQK